MANRGYPFLLFSSGASKKASLALPCIARSMAIWEINPRLYGKNEEWRLAQKLGVSKVELTTKSGRLCHTTNE